MGEGGVVCALEVGQMRVRVEETPKDLKRRSGGGGSAGLMVSPPRR